MSEVELYPGRVSPRHRHHPACRFSWEYSGLELLERVVDGRYPAPPIAATLNFTLSEVAEGRAVFHGLPGERHLNPLGGVHGGWASDAARFRARLCRPDDAAEGRGLRHHRVQGEPDAADHAEDRRGRLRGRVVHRGKTVAVSEATLKDGNGKLLALGTETCSIFPVANLAAR